MYLNNMKRNEAFQSEKFYAEKLSETKRTNRSETKRKIILLVSLRSEKNIISENETPYIRSPAGADIR